MNYENSTDIEKLFLNQKPARILVHLKKQKNSCVGDISAEIDSTYAHTAKTMYRLRDHGLVQSEKVGRKTLYRLTSKGHELAEEFRSVLNTLHTEHQQPTTLQRAL